jgi:hypothetical protein
MAKGAIDAADNMNDLSQKTGVSVESLSKFQQAANASGTSIEGVGAAMIKLNRNLATGNAGAAEALTSLGISATDASGRLKSTDSIMLEVADRFAKMEDSANKSAAAQALFGKSGADLIPLLNGGRKSIEDLSATMTGDFAKGADSLNDKLAALQGKLLQVGVQIGTALMPALNVISDLVLNLANAFAAMPGPLQAVIGSVVALTAAFVVLAPAISAVISIAGVLAGLKIGATIAGWAAVAGPAITAITAIFSGLVAFLTGTIGPALLAFFTGPAGWTVLAVAAVVAMAIAFRQPITDFLVWMGAGIKAAWAGITSYFQTNLVKPIQDGWRGLTEALPRAMNAAAGMAKNAWRGVLQYIANQINSVGRLINNLILAYNKLPAADIPLIPTMTIPAFAQGAVVSRSTVAMVGDGGEDEYIVPASKMAAASSRFLSGARGAAVIPSGSGGGARGAGGNPSITVTTGPVLEFDEERYVTISDFERGLQQVAGSVYRGLRTPAGRYATGVR